MNHLTITSREFSRLDEARHLQVERYRTAHFRQSGELPKDTDPATSRRWLRVLLNGRDCCIPVALLTRWADTFDGDAPLTLDLAPNGVLTIQRGTSRLKVFTASPMLDAKGKGWLTAADSDVRGFPAELPEAISMLAENGVVRLDLPDVTAELAALARETTTNRKAVAKQKALAKARKVEKTALDALNRHTEDAEAAQAVVDGQTFAEALAFARRCLAARRVFTASLAAPDTLPAWMPATYAGEVWDSEAATFKPCTVDAGAEWGELVAALTAARTAREAYKPTNRWPSYMSQAERKANPDRAFRVYGPAFDKLKAADDKARRDLTGFLAARYREHLATLGLPDSLAVDSPYAWSVLHGVQAYTRARQLLRTWPQRRDDLQSAHSEAVVKREGLEGNVAA